MKELLKSVHIYRKNKSGTFFIAHGVFTAVWRTRLFNHFRRSYCLATLYDRLFAASCRLSQMSVCLSVRLSIALCIVALRVGVVHYTYSEEVRLLFANVYCW